MTAVVEALPARNVVRVAIVREIEPLDKQTCDGRCPWREGSVCSLFVAALLPLGRRGTRSGNLDGRRRRARECKQSERANERNYQRLVALRRRLALAVGRIGGEVEAVAEPAPAAVSAEPGPR